MKELFLDLSMGAAGDMLTAALLELCEDREEAVKELNSLGIPGVTYERLPVSQCGISGAHMKVCYLGEEEGHEHNHREHEYEHHHGHGHEHEHHHGHEHHHHHHGLKDIEEITMSLNLSEKLKAQVLEVYRIVAQAECQVHGSDMENIHFHELGTMDALADICAVCYLIDKLAPEHISASPLRLGCGTVKCAHGIMPVPAPATALIIKGMPTFAGDIEKEMCTPTGAALVKYFVRDFGQMPEMAVNAVGCGMGTRTFENKPNCLRAMIGEVQDSVIELCCNVDDMSPEAVGFLLERLMEEGALDAWYESVGMKKFRPGVIISCLCRQEQRDKMLSLIFKYSSTIGVRETLCRRYVLKREEEILESPYGNVRVKCSKGFGVERRKAEFEDLARISRDKNLSLEDIKNQLEM